MAASSQHVALWEVVKVLEEIDERGSAAVAAAAEVLTLPEHYDWPKSGTVIAPSSLSGKPGLWGLSPLQRPPRQPSRS
jgi:hypothetical protein